jgi:hypothetical protein
MAPECLIATIAPEGGFVNASGTQCVLPFRPLPTQRLNLRTGKGPNSRSGPYDGRDCDRPTREDVMTDPHQVNLIIANAICDAHKDHQENRMNAEEAKQIAKCIIEALSDAGLDIVPAGKIDRGKART